MPFVKASSQSRGEIDHRGTLDPRSDSWTIERNGLRTWVAVAKGRQTASDDHETAASYYCWLPPKVIGHVGSDKKGGNGANVEDIDEDCQLVVVDGDVLTKKLAPE